MPNISLEDIYKNLSPVSINSSNVIRKDIFDILADCFYDPSGKAYTFDMIKKQVEEFVLNSPDDDKKTIKDNFHGIGGSSNILDDNVYWGGYETTQHTTSTENMPIVSVFSIRGPNITPSKRGTKKIDFFLNYTPPIVSAQMVPYLDIKFKTKKTSSSNISTPSMIRFLLGSGDVDKLGVNDKFIQQADTFKNGTVDKDKIEENSSLFGMEMFLMPQTLTNMDSLGESKTGLTRIVRVKPFVPFASIEGLDINVVNAGAGAFAHKKATLKLKIHDKSRIAEISDFIRGSSGFSKVSIETIYGWSAPSNRGEEDEYCKFINNHMRTKELWAPSNAQYSFDGSGQVSLNIEMVSQAGKILQDATLAGGEAGIDAFYDAVKVIEQTKKRVNGQKENSFAISATTEKFFNSTSSNGIYLDIKQPEIEKIVTELITAVGESKVGNLTKEEKEAFKEALDLITGKKSGWQSTKSTLEGYITNKFNNLAKRVDPFKPRKVGDLFSADLIDVSVSKVDHILALPKDAKPNPDDLSINVNGIASFGKVFLDFVIPQISKQMCDEVQVFFYGLNDECGYISGCSVAEVPIDLTVLSNAYSLKVKELKKSNIQIEVLLNIISNTHFSDLRAIGFGMNQFYKRWDKNKPSTAELNDNNVVKNNRLEWLRKNGDIKIPTIEMFTEIVEAVGSSNNIVKIKRIHVYDKKNTAFSFEQQILDNGDGGYVIGKKTALSKTKKELITHNAFENKSRDEMNAFIAKVTEPVAKVLKAGIAAVDTAIVTRAVEATVKKDFEIIGTKERGAIKNYLLQKLPSLTIGTNGTLIFNASVASKTDNLQGALNIINSTKSTASSTSSPSSDGLADTNLPLRASPMQVTLSSLGVPTAQLYQKFFIDFGTGTTIDNIYVCSQIQHSMSQGKFTTNWTFIYDNGYGKFTSPPAMSDIVSGITKEIVSDSKDGVSVKQK